MKKRLALIVNEKTIDLVIGLGKIPTAISSIIYEDITNLGQSIEYFLESNKINSENVKEILIAIDFTMFLKNIKKSSFGYIQLGNPMSYNQLNIENYIYDINLFIDSFSINNLNTKDTKIGLENFLKALVRKNINKIAINNPFSNFNKNKEKEIINTIQNIYGNDVVLFPSHFHSISNYLVRENMLFLNIMLYENVKKMIDNILDIFNVLNINSNVFFMRGNGTLTSLDFILQSSSDTWKSIYSSMLIGSSIIAGEKNSYVLTKNEANLEASIIQDGMPLLLKPLSHLENLVLSPNFPWIIDIQNNYDQNNLASILSQNNVYQGEVPVISFVESIKPHSVYPYELIKLENSSYVAAVGILNAHFQFNISGSIQDMNPKIVDKTKDNLKQKAFNLLKKHNIKIQNIEYFYSITPVKYNSKNTSIINLTINGQTC